MSNKEMLKKQADDFLENLAINTGEALVEPCINCNETIYFALKDKDRGFSLGLITILECLRFAEEQGEVPELPNDWWISIINKYKLKYKLE